MFEEKDDEESPMAGLFPENREELLRADKFRLLVPWPFFSGLLLSLKVMWINKLPFHAPVGTDGTYLFVSPTFFNYSNAERPVIMCAAGLSCWLLHPNRRGDRHPVKWAMADNMVVNRILQESLPDGGSRNFELKLPKHALIAPESNMSVERVYEMIPDSDVPKEPPEMFILSLALEAGEGGDEDRDRIPASEIALRWEELRRSLTEQYAGNMPAGMARKLDLEMRSNYSLADALLPFVEKIESEYTTYSKPDVWMPTICSEEGNPVMFPGKDELDNLPEGACVIDTSGSQGPDEFKKTVEALKGVFQRFPHFKLHVLYSDAAVTRNVEITIGELEELEDAPGGGGTAFQPAFDWIRQNLDGPPLFCIYLTDLECFDTPEDPGYPVIWACNTDHDDWPWGTTVRI